MMKDDAGKDVRVLNPNGLAEWPVRGDRRMALLLARILYVRLRAASFWARWKSESVAAGGGE